MIYYILYLDSNLVLAFRSQTVNYNPTKAIMKPGLHSTINTRGKEKQKRHCWGQLKQIAIDINQPLKN